MANQTKYDILQDQLKFIEQEALKRFSGENNDGNAVIFIDVTPKLSEVCLMLSDVCGPGFHRDETGNCVPD